MILKNPRESGIFAFLELAPEYKHDIILHAFGILHERGIDFRLSIVGEGIQFGFLKELSQKLKIDTIEYICNNPDLRKRVYGMQWMREKIR